MRRPLQWIALLAVVAIAAWLGWRHYEREWLAAPITALVQPVTFEIAQGASLTTVARPLASGTNSAALTGSVLVTSQS